MGLTFKKKEPPNTHHSTFTPEEERFFQRLRNAYDVFINLSDSDTDQMIIKIFAYEVQKMVCRNRMITMGYGEVYVKVHKNCIDPEKQKLTMTFNEWTNQIEELIKNTEDI